MTLWLLVDTKSTKHFLLAYSHNHDIETLTCCLTCINIIIFSGRNELPYKLLFLCARICRHGRGGSLSSKSKKIFSQKRVNLFKLKSVQLFLYTCFSSSQEPNISLARKKKSIEEKALKQMLLCRSQRLLNDWVWKLCIFKCMYLYFVDLVSHKCPLFELQGSFYVSSTRGPTSRFCPQVLSDERQNQYIKLQGLIYRVTIIYTVTAQKLRKHTENFFANFYIIKQNSICCLYLVWFF